MAEKSGGDKVKKGFIFYIFMLLLLLIAAFLIIVMIMLFSPRTVILGYQYFNYSSEYDCVKTNDAEPVDLNFSQIKKINVNASYASVSITKSSDEKSVDTIHVVNNTKGFAHSDDFVDFECSVLTDHEESSTLNISIKEPESFLYFSKDIHIEIVVSKDNVDNLSDTEISINTKAGNVNIGSTDENATTVEISNLSVTTESGNINLNENNGEEDEIIFDRLLLSTKSGKIIVPEAKSSVKIINEAKFTISGNGAISFNKLFSTLGVKVAVNDGSFQAKTIEGKVIVTNLKNGNITIDEIISTDEKKSSFVVEDEDVGKAKIKIGSVNYVAIPIGNQADIEIDTIKGGSIIRTTSGNITINKHAGNSFNFETQTGKIDITIDDENKTSGYYRSIRSETGDIAINFANYVKNIQNIRTNGAVDITLPKDTKFLLDVYTGNDQPIKEIGGKFTISFIKADDYYEHYKVNYIEGDDENIYKENVVAIYSDGNINVHLA